MKMDGVGQTVTEEVYEMLTQLDFNLDKQPLDLRSVFLKMAELQMISPECIASIERKFKK